MTSLVCCDNRRKTRVAAFDGLSNGLTPKAKFCLPVRRFYKCRAVCAPHFLFVVLFVRLDNLLHKRMADNVLVRQADYAYVVDVL